MSNPEPSLHTARRWHWPAIIGIVVALGLAALALLMFAPLGGTTTPPAATDATTGTATVTPAPAATSAPAAPASN